MNEEACFNPNCTRGRDHPGRCDGKVVRDCRHGRLARVCQECEDYDEIAALRAELDSTRARLAVAEKERDAALEALDVALGEEVNATTLDEIRRETKARVDSGEIPPFVVCGWCGAAVGTTDTFKAHALECSKNPAVQRAEAAERERDEARLGEISAHGQAQEAYEARLAAEARLRECVEALRGLLAALDKVPCGPCSRGCEPCEDCLSCREEAVARRALASASEGREP